MAYLNQDQVRQILQNAPPNLDKQKLITELAKTHTLQGYNDQQTAPQQDGFFKSMAKDPIKELVVRPGVRIAQALVAPYGTEMQSGNTQARDSIAQSDQKLLELAKRTTDPARKAQLISQVRQGQNDLNKLQRSGEFIQRQNQVFETPQALQTPFGNYNIKEQKGGVSGVKQIAGDALKSASYLYTPGAAGEAIAGTQTFGQTALRAGLQTAKVGAITGAAYNAGDALQNDKSIGETLKSTAIGAGTGAVVGFATGATLATVSHLPEKMKQNTINRYDELFNGTKSGGKLLDKSIAKGKSPSQFLVDHNLIVDIEKGKVNATPTIEKISANVQPYNEVLDDILKVKDETIGSQGVSLHDLGESVKRRIASNPQNRASGYLGQQLKQVDNIIGDLVVQYGDDVNYQTLNQIKQAQWQQAAVFDMTRPNFAKDIHYNFGTVAKDEIQNAFKGQADIQGLNSYIGDHYDAIKNLQNLDGKAIKGGRLGTYFGRVVGAAAGASHGPIGSIVGAQVGDTVATVMQNTYLSNPIKKIILAKMADSAPVGSAVMVEAQKALQQLQQESIKATTDASVMSTKYGLPAPNVIYGDGVDKTAMKVTYSPRPTNPRMLPAPDVIYADTADKTATNIYPSDVNIQRNPQTGKMQKVFQSTSEQAKTGAGPTYSLGKKIINGVKSVNDTLNEVTPGLYTTSKYNITYKDGNQTNVLKNLTRDEATSWTKYFKEKGTKFAIKTLGAAATVGAIKKSVNRSTKTQQ